MPFNGSGTCRRRAPNLPAAADGSHLRGVLHQHHQHPGMLTNCVTRDGQSPLSQNLPANGKKIYGLADGTVLGMPLPSGQSGVSLGSLNVPTLTGVTSIAGGPNFPLTAPTVPTGVDRSGGSNAASQQYVEVAAARAATEVIPTVSKGAGALAIFNFMGA